MDGWRRPSASLYATAGANRDGKWVCLTTVDSQSMNAPSQRLIASFCVEWWVAKGDGVWAYSYRDSTRWRMKPSPFGTSLVMASFFCESSVVETMKIKYQEYRRHD